MIGEIVDRPLLIYITLADNWTPVPRHKRIIGMLSFWGALVLTVGISRAWFGGAIIIDVMVAVAAIIFVMMALKDYGGHMVNMDRNELQAWVEAGMPDNIENWRHARAWPTPPKAEKEV